MQNGAQTHKQRTKTPARLSVVRKTRHVRCAYRTRPMSIPDTSGMLDSTQRLWEKTQKPHQTVSKNHEILTLASRHHREGLHKIWARNSKVENTGHVRYRRAVFCNFEKQAQNSIKSPWIDLKFSRKSGHKVYRILLKDHHPIWCESTEIKETRKNPSKRTLALDSSRSVISWGIRWFPSVKTFNSRHWSKPSKRNESKHPRNDESKEKLEGKVKSSRRTHQ
jgi:hypothetical protein